MNELYDVLLIGAKLTAIFLAHFVFLLWFLLIHIDCSLFLFDNETSVIFIHNFKIWCKITKFISFFSKN